MKHPLTTNQVIGAAPFHDHGSALLSLMQRWCKSCSSMQASSSSMIAGPNDSEQDIDTLSCRCLL